MPHLYVSRKYSFEAAHALRSYHGEPEPLHGHTWQLEITLEGAPDEEGMVWDFLAMDKVVGERILQRVNYTNLNDLLEQSTAENLALWAWSQLEDLPLHEIRVWETANGWVTYRGESESGSA